MRLMIYWRIGRFASEEVTLYLISTKCIPCLLHASEALSLNAAQLNSLKFSAKRVGLLFNTFKTASPDIISHCQEFFTSVFLMYLNWYWNVKPVSWMDYPTKRLPTNKNLPCDVAYWTFDLIRLYISPCVVSKVSFSWSWILTELDTEAQRHWDWKEWVMFWETVENLFHLFSNDTEISDNVFDRQLKMSLISLLALMHWWCGMAYLTIKTFLFCIDKIFTKYLIY